MTHVFLTLALAVAGIGTTLAPVEATPAQSAGMDGAARQVTGKDASQSCLPLVRDYFWLDYARMGMGGMGANSGSHGNTASRNRPENRQQNQNRTRNRRMRMVHLRHDGFPETLRDGCPTCQARGRWQGEARPDLAARPDRNGQRHRQRAGDDRHGMDPEVAKAVIWLETPDNLIHRIDPEGPGRLRFNARMWGQYRVFAHVDAGVKDGVRQLHYAFLDLFAHGDDVTRRERPKINGNGYENGRPLFFLERLYTNDRQRYRTQTGEEVRFRLTLHGRPVKGACVVMITQKDWRKARRTDENGEVTFFVIKETPSEGGWRARRRSEKYLVVAQHFEPAADDTSAAAGNGIRGTRYVASQLLRVRPSRLEWESKSTAFLLASFTAVAAGAAIAVRRVRRRRCKREGGQ